MKLLMIAMAALLLAGCRNAENAAADGRVLWDAEGCAYFVRPHLGDTSFIRPVPDANKASCPGDEP